MTSKSRKFSLSLLTAFAFVLCSVNLPAQTPPSGGQRQTGSSAPAKSAGMVWVNTDSGVYHKQDSRWYGKTKHGKYMLEPDAIKAGYKPAK